jgi:glycosyltransferase involved in cell wall biosynthesis
MSVEPTLVSVLIPAFNAEKYLRETLASVANQTYRNLEIIVVDDGSSDGTGAIVQEFSRSDRRVRSIRQPNRGVAAARNHALSLARGELVAPIDADDLWHSRKIEKQLQKMVTAGQSVGLVYSWMCTISDVGLAIAFNRPADSGASPPLSRMVESNFVGCASVPLMRTATVREVGGYDETLRQARAEGCEDYDLYLKLAERWSFTLVTEYLVGYRRSSTSMSTDVWKMQRSHEKMMQNLRRRHPELPSRAISTSYRRMGFWLAVNCIRERRMLTGAALACSVLRSDPLAPFRRDSMRYAKRIAGELLPVFKTSVESSLEGRRFPFENSSLDRAMT